VLRLGVVLLAMLLGVPATASALSVAYVDADQVWLASPDGAQRRVLTGPTADALTWRKVAQADNGAVIAVEDDRNQDSTVNAFRLFDPGGALVKEGRLPAEPGFPIYRYPITLDLAPDGTTTVYGYGNGFAPSSYEAGTYVVSALNPSPNPSKMVDLVYPSLAGGRTVAAQRGRVFLQRAGMATPLGTSQDFTSWLDLSASGLDLDRTDVAANGRVAAVELETGSGSSRQAGILVLPFGAPGEAPQPGGCELPVQGPADDVSLSQDGGTIAWKDDRGVVVAGAPDFSGADPCVLTRAPVVIAAGGSSPSLGPAVVQAPAPGPSSPAPGAGPAGGGGPAGGPTPAPAARRLVLKAPARATAASLRRGLALQVDAPRAGTVTVVGRVAGRVVARGTARAARAGVVRVVLRATSRRPAALRRLRGKVLRLRAAQGADQAAATVRLR
jgi:hypothetical protein